MGVFPEEQSFVYPTNQDGSPVVVTVVGAIERIKSENAKLNYKGKNEANMGYYDVIPVVTEDGQEKKLKISTWLVYFALKELKPEIGDVIKIERPKNKEYKITKV